MDQPLDDVVLENPQSQPAAATASPNIAPTRSWAWLSNQNPFYLLSAACVMHSTGWNFGGKQELPAWLTPLLIAGYIALLATAGGLIVRWWRVWDDARSIFVTLLILFLELAMSLDQFAVRSPGGGVPVILGGWCFAVLISESLLLGLGMRLPTIYRVSFHLQLGLLFGYPLLLIPGTFWSANGLLTGLLLSYAVLIAIPLLMLWPAVRRGPAATIPNGTPWTWPCYPWTLPAVLSGVLVTRAFSLCLTYDPVAELPSQAAYQQFASIFGGYFLVPTILAAGGLMLEGGLARGGRLWQRVGLTAPLAALLLSFAWEPPNTAAQGVLDLLTRSIGGPVWLTLWLGIMFYGWAALRRVAGATQALMATLLLLSMASPATLTWDQLVRPSLEMLAALSFVCLIQAIRTGSSRWAIEGAIGFTVMCQFAHWLPTWGGEPLLVAGGLLYGQVCLITLVFDDQLARELRESTLVLLGLMTLLGGIRGLLPLDPWWLIPAGLLAGGGFAALYQLIRQVRQGWEVARIAWCLSYITLFLQGSYELQRAMPWRGYPAFALGLVLLHLGLLRSAWKGRTVKPATLLTSGGLGAQQA